MRCTVDGGAEVDCTKGLNLTGLAAGEHTLVAVQTDAAGNTSKAASYSWTVKAGKVVLTTRIAKKGVISSKKQVTVICKLSGDTIKVCNVKLYARVGKRVVVIGAGRRALKAPKVAKGKVVKGKVAPPVGKPTLGVKVTLNKAGKRLLAKKPKAIKVTIKSKALPSKSAKVTAKVKAKIKPRKVG